MSIMGRIKKIFSWFLLITSGVIGFASTGFASMAGQFSNCSKICGLAPWDFIICASQNVICSITGPLFQVTYLFLLALSVLLFIFAYILFSGWDT